MTPRRLLALVSRATGRTPTRHELDDWGAVLACPPHVGCPAADCVHDDEADEALLQHRRASTYPPTPADVRRLTVPLANARIDAQLHAERTAAVPGAVPPTEDYLAAKRRLLAAQAERTRELERAVEPQPTPADA